MKQIYEKIWKINVIDWKVTSRLEERGTPLGLLFSSLKPLAPGEFPKSYQEMTILESCYNWKYNLIVMLQKNILDPRTKSWVKSFKTRDIPCN